MGIEQEGIIISLQIFNIPVFTLEEKLSIRAKFTRVSTSYYFFLVGIYPQRWLTVGLTALPRQPKRLQRRKKSVRLLSRRVPIKYLADLHS